LLSTTRKIDEEVFNRKLAYEFKSAETTIAQMEPKLFLGRCRARSQDAGPVGLPWRRSPHAVGLLILVMPPLTLALSPFTGRGDEQNISESGI
jgi:hypothetical protein